MAIAYSDKAESDLLDILEYGHTAWPGTADDFMVQLQQRIEATLTSHPSAGRKGREQGTREWVLTGTPYIVVYVRRTAGDIEVWRVLHGAQQWPAAGVVSRNGR